MAYLMGKDLPRSLRKRDLKLKGLYYRGEAALLDESVKKVAIVGSRRITDYGKRVIEKMVPELVQAGVVIVSGFMYGVDQMAHKTCLDCGGKTVAVLGWGIDWLVPADDLKLMGEIETGGLLVSEYKGETAPLLWKFPQRNRVITAMSDVILIVEAGEKSGSLITARWAIRQKKKLFCVPGPITSKMSWGTNMLIKNGEAKMVTGVEDVLKELECTPPLRPSSRVEEGKREKYGLGFIENSIIAVLENESLLIDEIAMSIRRPIEEVGPAISLMEMRGWLKCENGRYYLA